MVELFRERWEHIVDPVAGHPELQPFQTAVKEAVSAPMRGMPGRRPGEEWFQLTGDSPRTVDRQLTRAKAKLRAAHAGERRG